MLASRCTSCTEPIDTDQPHVVVSRSIEHHENGEAIVELAAAIAQYHPACAPNASAVLDAILADTSA